MRIKIGNDGADWLAVAGAAAHHVLPEVVASAKSRRQLAKRTHGMMVAILSERLRQETLLVENAADRGSDVGDDVACIASVAASDIEDRLIVHASDNEDCIELNVQEFNNSMMHLTGDPAS